MYYYVYDLFLTDQRFQKSIERVEARLLALGISGHKIQLTLLKSLQELVLEKYQAGVRNFIAVGDDKSFLNLISAVADFDVTVGYIPIVAGYFLATQLGLPAEEAACDVLSARITQEVDLGKINHYYFLTYIKVQTESCRIECDHNYNVELPYKDVSIEIVNLNTHIMLPDMVGDISALDGKLHLVIQSPARPGRGFLHLFKKSNRSVSFFSVKNIKITEGVHTKALVDGYRTVNLPFEISVLSKKIKIIVGKDRKVLL